MSLFSITCAKISLPASLFEHRHDKYSVLVEYDSNLGSHRDKPSEIELHLHDDKH